MKALAVVSKAVGAIVVKSRRNIALRTITQVNPVNPLTVSQ